MEMKYTGVRAQAIAAWNALFEGKRGPRLLCCGEWGMIAALPHKCQHCGRVYFVEKLPAVEREG